MINDDNTYVSLHSLKEPKHPLVLDIYNKFKSEFGLNYLEITESAIRGSGSLASSSPLQNSAAASLALVTIDLHIAILEQMHQGVQSCRDGNDALVSRVFFDRAVALTIGWTEGRLESGSDTDGYLFFQIAQEVCKHFSSCDGDGDSIINKQLITSFSNADGILSLNDCNKLEEEVEIIETYLQAIIIDNLAYHLNSIDQDARHYLLAHISAYSLLPLMKTTDHDSADVVEINLGDFPSDLILVDGVEAVYSALKQYVDVKGIDCSLLGSAICEGPTTSDADTESTAAPNISGMTLASGEYTPFTDVSDISSGLTTTMNKMCNAADSKTAKDIYINDNSSGLTLESLSLSAQDVMTDEVLFNQYVYSFIDDIDKTDGSLLFDKLPAVEYSNTIISDAIDNNIALGCMSVKSKSLCCHFQLLRFLFSKFLLSFSSLLVLSLWMFVVHKLNDSIQECKVGDASKYGSIDEAAAFWIGSVSEDDKGGLLYQLAEELGENFAHKNGEYMTKLNQSIISRLNLAQTTFFVNSSRCKTDVKAVATLRKIFKEVISYMTAVLIQGFIHSMLGKTSLLTLFSDESDSNNDLLNKHRREQYEEGGVCRTLRLCCVAPYFSLRSRRHEEFSLRRFGDWRLQSKSNPTYY